MIYLIHFDKPLHHAKHYLGFCESLDGLEDRLARHKAGTGAKILKALNEKQISYYVVKTFSGDRNRERQLKKHKNTPRLCPICREKGLEDGKASEHIRD